MGTPKRERQKANRALRQQEELRSESRRRTTRIAIIVIGAIVGVFALVWIASNVVGDDEDDTVEPLATAPPIDEGAVDTAPVGTEPAPFTTVAAAVDPNEVGCPPTDGSGEAIRAFSGPPPSCLEDGVIYTAVITTNKGEFTVELDQEQAPETVNSFVFLARYQYFDDTVCHRIIPGFVVQCGDPTATGTGGPGYQFEDELPEEGEYEVGSIAMANSGPNTNGSQFFIITGEQGAALPPLYSLFGAVTTGFDETVTVMEAAGTASGSPNEDIEIISVEIVES